jgi:acetyltransferase-like isoleucine patch superfamily enzyme
MREYCENIIPKDGFFASDVELGFPTPEHLRDFDSVGVKIGNNPVIRSRTTIYSDVTIGNNFKTGHNVLIRENTRIGNDVSIGSGTIVDGYVTIGDNVNIQSMVYIPKHVIIYPNVFIGPRVTFTNDKYPPDAKHLSKTVVKSHAIIGAGAIILPGITINEHAFVAAGALVTRDVPEGWMAIGSPAKIQKIPEQMSRGEW